MNTNNWTIDQTRRLFSLAAEAKAAGKSLSEVFRTVAAQTGRSLNSVRNYYYSQAKTFELVPEVAEKLGIQTAEVQKQRFVPFADDEVRALVEYVLTACGGGKSVRGAIYELAGGDEKRALRYQNKYRSVLRSHRDLVAEVSASLSERGVVHSDPYRKADNIARLTEYIAAMDSERARRFLAVLEKLT